MKDPVQELLEDEFLDDDNETIKRGNSILETSSSRDDSDIVPVRIQLDSRVCKCFLYKMYLFSLLIVRYDITIKILLEFFPVTFIFTVLQC